MIESFEQFQAWSGDALPAKYAGDFMAMTNTLGSHLRNVVGFSISPEDRPEDTKELYELLAPIKVILGDPDNRDQMRNLGIHVDEINVWHQDTAYFIVLVERYQNEPGNGQLTAADSMVLDRLCHVAIAATPGPWRNGSWFHACKKPHAHAGEKGADPFEYEAIFSPGGNLIAAGSSAQPVHVIGNDEERGVTIRPEDKTFIATFNPEMVLHMLGALQSCGFPKTVPDETVDPKDAETARWLKRISKTRWLRPVRRKAVQWKRLAEIAEVTLWRLTGEPVQYPPELSKRPHTR